MKIWISYFYKIRFFKPNMIPLSTACWDPKWFTHYGEVYKDKRGVYNGIRAEPLHMPEEMHEGESSCRGPEYCGKNPGSCGFLQAYYEYLNSLDFSDIIKRAEALAYRIKSLENFEEEPEVVLIVYETPKNPCSERGPLQRWFKEHGMELEEWEQ